MNPRAPFFSIVIPVFNGGATIGKTLESIREQIYPEYEVLIMDSLSFDDTEIIIESYYESISNIRVFREKDNGVYDAMNKALSLVRGEYVYFMGSDDVFFSGTVLSDTRSQLQNDNMPDFFYGNVLLGNTNIIHNGHYNLTKLYDLNICHQSIFYKKNVFETGLRYNLEYKAYADWHLNFQIFTSRNFRVVYHNYVVGRYGLGGLSSQIEDPLSYVKKEVFLLLAKRLYKDEYFRLKRHTFDTKSIVGLFNVLYYHLLYLLCRMCREVIRKFV